MAGNFTVNGDGTVTVSFTWTRPTQVVQDFVTNAASALHDRGKGQNHSLDALSALNNNQTLQIVDRHIRNVIVSLAKQNITDYKLSLARIDATDAGSTVEL